MTRARGGFLSACQLLQRAIEAQERDNGDLAQVLLSL